MFVVVLWGMKRRNAILNRYSSSRGLAVIAAGSSSIRRWIKAGLVLTALLFTAISLSGPQYGFKWQEVERKGIDIMVALDCSRSMLATDVQPTRLERAKRKISDLLGMLAGDRIGLVSFAGTAFLQCPLTMDYEAFHIFLNTLSPDSLPVGGTDMAAAVQTALSGFEQTANTEKAIIFITDGESTTGDPLAAAEAAAKAGVKLFCIGVGNKDGVPVPSKAGGFEKDRTGKIVLARLDEDTLQKMALKTGGVYVASVTGDMDLKAIYQDEIRGKMDPATLTTQRKQVWEDRFQWPLFLALAALIAEMFISAKKKEITLLLMLIMISLGTAKPVPAQSVSESAGMGQAAYAKGEYEKAIKHFIDAQLEDPDRPEISYNLGNAYYKQGDYDSALRNYQKALNAKDPALRQKASYNLGNAAFRKKQFKEAIANYEAALKIAPQDEEAAQNLAFTRKALEKQQEQEKNPSDKNGKDQADQENGEKAQNQPGGQQEKGSDPKAKEQSQASPDQEQNQAGSEKTSPESQQKSAGGDQNSSSQPPPPMADPEMKNNGNEPKPQTAAGKDGKAAERNQAEHLLNRLQDLPAAAMSPRYGKTEVEKDW